MNIRCEQVNNIQAIDHFDRRIGILIPAFNEGARLGRLLATCRRIQPAVVMVVDDASTDSTPLVLERVRCRFGLSLPLVVLRNEANTGKQGAVRRGLRELAGWDLDAVALVDGDGQHDPAELPGLARLLERYDMVIGARSKAQMPMHRQLSNWLVNRGFEWIGGVDFCDVQSGLRIYKKWLVDVLADRLPPEGGYALEHESLTVLARYARDNQRCIRAAAAPASCSYGDDTSSMEIHHVLDLAVQTVRQAVRFRRASRRPDPALAAVARGYTDPLDLPGVPRLG
jgi:glycosyltransferase involved in cell wall biosynthesis